MERRTLLAGLALAGLTGSASAANVGAAPTGDNGGPPTREEAALGSNLPASRLPRIADPGERRGDMLYRLLGATGERVSAVGFGGSHFCKPGIEEAESLRLLHAAIDRGITFMDNSWDYNKGVSEERMGLGLSQGGYRQRVFLMTKIDGRTRETAAQQIDESLRRLRTDHVDLLQFHEVLRYDDPDRIFNPGGALEAVLAARQAGKLRYIGFTGHKDPHIHLYMLEVAARHGFRFDTAQMPLNVMDAHFRSFAQLVVPRLIEQNIGVLGMKTFGGGDGIILKSGAVAPLDCLHYSMNLPTSVVITGIDNQRALDQAFEAARTFRLLDEHQVAAILARTESHAESGHYELFKTSAHFDTTARHADWLGGDAPPVQKLAPKNSG